MQSYQFYITNKITISLLQNTKTETTRYIALGCELGGLIVEGALCYCICSEQMVMRGELSRPMILRFLWALQKSRIGLYFLRENVRI